ASKRPAKAGLFPLATLSSSADLPMITPNSRLTGSSPVVSQRQPIGNARRAWGVALGDRALGRDQALALHHATQPRSHQPRASLRSCVESAVGPGPPRHRARSQDLAVPARSASRRAILDDTDRLVSEPLV